MSGPPFSGERGADLRIEAIGELEGPHLLGRGAGLSDWRRSLRAAGAWPYGRVLAGRPGPRTIMRGEEGRTLEGLDFASTDALGLASHPAVLDAAVAALRTFGPHAASAAPSQSGDTTISLALEAELAEHLRTSDALVFPSGRQAACGTIFALVQSGDHIVIDDAAPPWLLAAARASVARVWPCPLGQVEAAREQLARIRADDPRGGILVVAGALSGHGAGAPDLPELQEAAEEHGAVLLVEAGYDFGAMGPAGTGLIGFQSMLGRVDLIVGDLCTSFATDGGFLAVRDRAAKERVKLLARSQPLAGALSPVAAAVAREALRIVRSREGDERRERLALVIRTLRDELAALGRPTLGLEAPVIPIFAGPVDSARWAAATLFELRVFVHLVEPVGPAPGANACLLVHGKATHSRGHALDAARTIARCLLATEQRRGR